ncbi:hypothetical protein Dda_0121 [Drechslerella dactyloides]|uniref:TauD/TfdA-like domain-containing protein n=1 Tax=Drechslerella dactyloides TaxID=74499 RepID=A0AAD6J3S5_DREDA|nr:hypothetical protein Dda_0121 [Drechslerella dactyloides]
MQHIYQIIDCDSARPASGCERSLLISKQDKLDRTDFPEAKSGGHLAAAFSRNCAIPVYISPEFLSYIQKVSDNLHTAVTDIVSRWWDDGSVLSTYMPVDPKIERILRRLHFEGPSWQTGSWRPDFLIENDTEAPHRHPGIRICEINARFATNGGLIAEAFARFYQNSTSPLQPAAPELSHAFRQVFDSTAPIHILRGREVGYDINHLPKTLGKQTIVISDISKLRIVANGDRNQLLYTCDGQETEISQIVLELHQDELLSLPEDILWEVSLRARINDIRTIMFAHDKRMLAIIRQQLPEIVARGSLSPEAATILENSLAETYLPHTPEYERATKTERDQDWLFKPALSGKGDGIVFRKDMPEEDWQTLLSESSLTVPHVLQKAVDQKVMKFRAPFEGSFAEVELYAVGTFFNINGYFRGFGVFRASADKVCAISNGGYAMLCVCDRACLPFAPNPNLANRRPLKHLMGKYDRYGGHVATEGPDSAYHSDDAESTTGSDHSTANPAFPPKIIVADSAASGGAPSHVAQVHQCLEAGGIALVKLNFEDPESDYLVSLVRDGLSRQYKHGLPVDHSQTKGWLWDVKPVHSKIENNTTGEPLARSETMNVFPWHTDCSFEDAPPRHFALHVIHADRYGGGALSIVRTKDIIQELSEEAISSLSQPEFILDVPGEFDKGIGSLTGSLIDMSNNDPKLRYRRDIIHPLTQRAQLALDELDAVLDDCRSKKVMKAEDLPDGMVIVLDNAKWLHARNQVNDPNRHLRRVRWNAQPFPSNQASA